MKAIRILVADDNSIYIDGLRAMFRKFAKSGIRFIGDANNGEEVITMVNDLQPDVVLLETALPLMNGIEVCRKIREQNSHIQVVAVTMSGDENTVLEMLNAGANGYVLKGCTKEELMEAIKIVTRGKIYYSAKISDVLTKQLRDSPARRQQRAATVTDREKQIIAQICNGHTSKEIGHNLGLSKRTVESYRDRIMEKLELENPFQLFKYALEQQICI